MTPCAEPASRQAGLCVRIAGMRNQTSTRRIRPRIGRRIVTLVMLALVGASVSLSAQWLNYPSPRAPRTKGQVDLAAPTPRLANGRPDLSGVWMTGEPACVIRGVLTVAELRQLLPPSRTCP